MKLSHLTIVALSGLLVATAAEAGPKGNKGHSGHGNKHVSFGQLNCPPGLAKKNPPCIPPGLARNHTAEALPVYQSGDQLPDDYIVLVNPQIFRPDLDAVYVSYGGILYMIDRGTAEVLDTIGPVQDWAWNWSATDPQDCPPGLAKKDPPCLPPGLVASGLTTAPWDQNAAYDIYGIGDTLPDGYVIAIDPTAYTANDSAEFVRQGDMIYRADTQTGQVLDPVGAVGKLIE